MQSTRLGAPFNLLRKFAKSHSGASSACREAAFQNERGTSGKNFYWTAGKNKDQ
jgi:hypothetical protein